MPDEPVRVDAYAGGRGEERPRAFTLGEERIEVAEILRAWIEERADGRERRRCFTVRGEDGREYRLSWDEKLKTWFAGRGGNSRSGTQEGLS